MCSDIVGRQFLRCAHIFFKLTGLAGGSPEGTAVYKADLSGVGLADLASISIFDNSGGLGGAAGQFSGFDLD